jgi:hypothetical protein
MKQRAASAVFSIVVFCSVGIAGAQQASPVGVWRFSKIQWVNAPKELGRSERSGNSGILRFYPDGTFTFVYDAIIQQEGAEYASEGDPWTIYQGTWRFRGHDIAVTYSLIYRDIHWARAGQAPDEKSKVVTKELFWRGGRLIFDHETYQRSPKLTASFDKVFSQPPHVPPLNSVGPP